MLTEPGVNPLRDGPARWRVHESRWPPAENPHEPDALGACCPPPADLAAQPLQWRRMPHIERVTEHARLHADPVQPLSDGLSLVRGVLGVPAARQDNHMRADHLMSVHRLFSATMIIAKSPQRIRMLTAPASPEGQQSPSSRAERADNLWFV